MRKCYAICDFLSEANKQHMRSVAEECGFEMGFFESSEEAAGKIGDAEVVYCDDGELMSGMPQLRWCNSVSAGVGHFLKSGVFDGGDVLLTNSSGAYGLAISEHIIMVTLLLMRRMPEYFKAAAERAWIRVIGFSRSGREREFFDEVYRIDDFESVLNDCSADDQIDVLVLCVPGTPDSEGLLSAERIALLPGKTFVINVGRGMLIDQEALIEALNEGRIAGAALDVMYPEPLPADHPLWTARNCIITPHISGDMGLPETVDITVDIFCDNLRRYADGRELTHLIDIHAGY